MRKLYQAAILAALFPLCAKADSNEAAVMADMIGKECVIHSQFQIVAVVEGVDGVVCNATASAISHNQSADSVVKALQDNGAEIF